MRFKFQLYDKKGIRFIDWLKLYKLAFMLLIRRLLRMGKRLLIYLKSYILTIICIILFELTIIPLGLKLGKYQAIVDGIWEIRTILFSSIFLAIVLGVIRDEKKRHEELVRQYGVYQEFMHASERFIWDICQAAGYRKFPRPYFSENEHNIFLEDIRNEFSNLDDEQIRNKKVEKEKFIIETVYLRPSIDRMTLIKISFSKYSRAIDRLEQNWLNHSFIGENPIEQLDWIRDELAAQLFIIEELQEGYSDRKLLIFADTISRCVYPAIAYIRRPWRWDIERNEHIVKILDKYK